MTGGKRTTEELIAEIEALKRELEDRDAKSDTPFPRRDLAKWIAPVVLSLPVVQVAAGLAVTLAGAKEAAAQEGGQCVPAPTASPTFTPTASPTFRPTASPTTNRRSPPTVRPTVAPVLGTASGPNCSSSPSGLVALGSARALSGVHWLVVARAA
ncbi:MAG: hypothetical protein ABSF69_11725 [Polyangiaceae bacterium]